MCGYPQHLLNYVKCVFADARQILSKWLSDVILEPYLLLFGEFVALTPIISVRSTEHSKYFIDLVEFTGTRKERLLEVEFTHDAAGCEDVRYEVIVMRSKYALWSPIPTCRNVGCVRPILNSKVFARAEINDFCNEWILVDHDVIGL